MENSTYKPEFLKHVEVIITDNYDIDIKEYQHTGTCYDVYSINCFYEREKPVPFLDILMKMVLQTPKSNDISLECTQVQYFIKFKNERLCKFYISKSKIVLENILTGEETTYFYGNKINNLNVFKFILKAIRSQDIIFKIKNYYMSSEGFKILDVAYFQKHTFYPSLEPDKSRLSIRVENIELETDFLVIYNIDTNKFKFQHYLEFEGEHYSNGDEPLTNEYIDSRIKYYTELKESAESIQLFLQQLQTYVNETNKI